MMDPEMKKLVGYAIAVITLAVLDLMGISILTNFKASLHTLTPNGSTSQNGTIDLFITGLTVFGTFIGIVVLAVVGKVVIKLFTEKEM